VHVDARERGKFIWTDFELMSPEISQPRKLQKAGEKKYALHQPMVRSYRLKSAGAVMGYIYVFSMVLLTVYAQLILKWRVDAAGNLPADFSEKVGYLVRLVTILR
jgi:hypothetical protein